MSSVVIVTKDTKFDEISPYINPTILLMKIDHDSFQIIRDHTYIYDCDEYINSSDVYYLILKIGK